MLNLEPKLRAFVDALEAAGLPPLEAGSPQAARSIMAMMRARHSPTAILEVGDRMALDAPVREYCNVTAPLATILYLHGGGWVLGSLDDSDEFCRTLATATRCRVVSLGYRLAPECPYPAALEDGMSALGWLATEYPASRIVLMGDSAGGNLAAVMAMRARDARRPDIAAQVLAYPVVDAGMDTPSYREFAAAPLLTAALMRWFWSHYSAGVPNALVADLSPLRGTLAGLPPALILTAQNDPLRDEGEAFARALAAAGVSTEFECYDGQIHGFLTLGISDGAASAMQRIVKFLNGLDGRTT